MKDARIMQTKAKARDRFLASLHSLILLSENNPKERVKRVLLYLFK